MAKATIENALFDLIAKREGVPLQSCSATRGRSRPASASGSRSPRRSCSRRWRGGGERLSPREDEDRRGCDVDVIAEVRKHFPAVRPHGRRELRLLAVRTSTISAASTVRPDDDRAAAGLSDTTWTTRCCRSQARGRRSASTNRSTALDDARAAIDLGRLPRDQHQAGPRRRPRRSAAHLRVRGVARRARVVGRDGRDGHRPRGEHPHADRATFFSIPGDTSETSRYFARDIVTPPVVLDAGGFIASRRSPASACRSTRMR